MVNLFFKGLVNAFLLALIFWMLLFMGVTRWFS